MGITWDSTKTDPDLKYSDKKTYLLHIFPFLLLLFFMMYLCRLLKLYKGIFLYKTFRMESGTGINSLLIRDKENHMFNSSNNELPPSKLYTLGLSYSCIAEMYKVPIRYKKALQHNLKQKTF